METGVLEKENIELWESSRRQTVMENNIVNYTQDFLLVYAVYI